MHTQRVLIIEEHRLLREGLGALLAQTPGIEVVGDSNGDSDISWLIGQLQPTIVLMDPSISDATGLETIQLVKRHHPAVRVVALTTQRSEQAIRDALSAGVDGYVLKQDSWQTLLEAIHSVDRGGLYLSSNLWETHHDAPLPHGDREPDIGPLDVITECVLIGANMGDHAALRRRIYAQRKRRQAGLLPRPGLHSHAGGVTKLARHPSRPR